MPRNDDKDHEYHLARFSGVRGDAFNTWEKSAREFLEAEFLKDDDHSLWDVIQELDQGSAHGPPIPAAGPAQNSAIRRRLKRQLTLKKTLSQAQDDQRLREMIINIPLGNNLTNDAAGHGVGKRAWLLLETECKAPMTALEKRLIFVRYNKATIRSLVGYKATSVTDFARALNSIMYELPAADQLGDTPRAEKILECIAAEPPKSYKLKPTASS